MKYIKTYEGNTSLRAQFLNILQKRLKEINTKDLLIVDLTYTQTQFILQIDNYGDISRIKEYIRIAEELFSIFQTKINYDSEISEEYGEVSSKLYFSVNVNNKWLIDNKYLLDSEELGLL